MLTLLMMTLAAQATPASAGANGGNKVRCIREEVIGSLIATRKVCHTLREWDAIRRNGNEEARRVIRPEGRPDNTGGG